MASRGDHGPAFGQLANPRSGHLPRFPTLGKATPPPGGSRGGGESLLTA